MQRSRRMDFSLEFVVINHESCLNSQWRKIHGSNRAISTIERFRTGAYLAFFSIDNRHIRHIPWCPIIHLCGCLFFNRTKVDGSSSVDLAHFWSRREHKAWSWFKWFSLWELARVGVWDPGVLTGSWPTSISGLFKGIWGWLGVDSARLPYLLIWLKPSGASVSFIIDAESLWLTLITFTLEPNPLSTTLLK